MRKLKLNLDELAVETFTTTKPAPAERGTVHGAGQRDPFTVVIADTVVTCTYWPAGPEASVDYCASAPSDYPLLCDSTEGPAATC